MLTWDETMEAAVNGMRGQDPAWVHAWIAIAGELRARETDSILNRISGIADALPTPEPTGEARLTLHDVEAHHCDHREPGTVLRYRVRQKGSTGWWLHTDDGSACDQP